MTAPAGAIVALHVDLEARVATGDVIATQTGRRYRVLDVRVQGRGWHVGRQHLRVVVLAPGAGGPAARERDAARDPLVPAGTWAAGTLIPVSRAYLPRLCMEPGTCIPRLINRILIALLNLAPDLLYWLPCSARSSRE
jgi:hypothetical protein